MSGEIIEKYLYTSDFVVPAPVLVLGDILQGWDTPTSLVLLVI